MIHFDNDGKTGPEETSLSSLEKKEVLMSHHAHPEVHLKTLEEY